MESPINPYTSPSANLFGSSGQTGGQLVSAEVISQLQRSKPWSRLVGVVAWLFVGLIMLGSVGVLAVAVAGALSSSAAGEQGFMIGMAAVYLLMSVIYIYPAIKIWGYGSAIKRLLVSRTEADLVAALDKQRSLWKFLGILTLFIIVIYAGIFLFAMTVGIAGAMKGFPTPGQ